MTGIQPDQADQMVPPAGLGFTREFQQTVAALERFADEMFAGPVAPTPDIEQLRVWLNSVDFEHGGGYPDILQALLDQVKTGNVHTLHPGYFGLFNPAPLVWGELADLISARLNPQLAVSSHAGAAVEIEEHVLRFIARRLNLQRAVGCFTTGGEEANRCGVHVALARVFPGYRESGLLGVASQPVLYVSAEAHLAWLKIASMLGLGRAAVRLVPVDPELRLDTSALRDLIAADRSCGRRPFFIGATAGTTAAGAIDPLPELASIAGTEGLHLHVDAAWAGAVALCDRWKHLLDGLERADSVTVDGHKWLSQPMGTGMFFCGDPHVLHEAFGLTASYMPPSSSGRDFYRSSPAWSRRWIGLRLFLSLAVAGRESFDAQIQRDIELGDWLRQRLQTHGWQIVNATPLPLVCFTDSKARGDSAWHVRVAAHVVRSGRAWISTVSVAGRPALRACITNWRTRRRHVEDLLAALHQARRDVDP